MKNCPYCSEKMIYLADFAPYYSCNNHGYIIVEIDERGLYIYYEKDTRYSIFIKEDKMILFDGIKQYSYPIDKSLTPENFEEKIEFYLMFK